MRSRKPLIAAAIAMCLLTSCASSPTPVTVPPLPLPAEYAVRCPTPPTAPVRPHPDEIVVALKTMYDLYGVCAGRFADLLDWLEEGDRDKR